MRRPGVRRSLGYAVADWIEYYLLHGPGDVQGQPIELDVEILHFLACTYAVGADGRRRFDEVLLSRAKGRAKSEIAGAIACAEALAPVRFDHWAEPGEVSDWGYEYQPGEPVGAPVTYPFIRCLATEETQVGNTYANITYMLAHSERIAEDYPGIDIGNDWQTSTRVFLPDGGEIRPSTSSSAAKDGGKESFSVADETHLYVLPELRNMYETVERNTMKRKAAEPWFLQTSTMYAIGEDSIAERTHRNSKAGAAPRLYFDHKQAPAALLEDEAYDDPVQLKAGLIAAYGPFAAHMDLDRMVALAHKPTQDRAKFRRYFLNLPVSLSETWLSRHLWERCALPQEVEPGELVTVGFDGSDHDDCTAITACRVSDGYVFTPRFPDGRPMVWTKWDDGDPDAWRVPRAEVKAGMTHVFTTFKVARAYGDPPDWRDECDDWAEEFGMETFLIFETRVATRMCPALDRFKTSVLTGEMTHDGHPTMAEHVGNAKPVRRPGGLIAITKPAPDRKIDSAVTAALAVEARADHLRHEAARDGGSSSFTGY
ncbi:terminase TerL endonuclease subunit [Kitasatospora sp. NPDC091335]|uniref:terminase TerL endonuclease subunit n=1 Tax=Kitasatospora sp. NPDC091335 TaxID=3364085 RepID=UPI00382E363E